LFSSPNAIRLIKSRRRWAGSVAHMDYVENAYRSLVGKPEGKGPRENVSVDGR
jgi:hypothetical protein